jgi:hypothetical protein
MKETRLVQLETDVEHRPGTQSTDAEAEDSPAQPAHRSNQLTDVLLRIGLLLVLVAAVGAYAGFELGVIPP